ncbi:MULTISPECIES: transketolase-like TK C-terminal-containing protein [unclassified Rhizobium]|uniref:transketolase-like TK C-terminal-containing protein n=1 Tax=unclassified Rhizobium TaxID=2613769 RepID=UPI00386F6E7A
MPSWDQFDAPSKEYREQVLGHAARIRVEALSKFAWTRYVASEDDVIGMIEFGASAPAGVPYEKFGITKQAIVSRALKLIGIAS